MLNEDEQQATTSTSFFKTTPRTTTFKTTTTTTRKPFTTTTFKSYIEPKTSPNAYTNDYDNNYVNNNAYNTGNNDEMPFTNFGDSYDYNQDLNNKNHQQNLNQYSEDYHESNLQENQQNLQNSYQQNLQNNFQQNLQNDLQQNSQNIFKENLPKNVESGDYDADARSDDEYYDEYDYDYETEISGADKSDTEELSWIQESAKNLENLLSMIKNLDFNKDSNGNFVLEHTTEKDNSKNNAVNERKDKNVNLGSQNSEQSFQFDQGIHYIFLFFKLLSYSFVIACVKYVMSIIC